MLAHNVYFTLNDNSDASKKALVAACRKYLTRHPAARAGPPGQRPRLRRRPAHRLRLARVARRLPGRPEAPPVRRGEPGELEAGAGLRLGGRAGLTRPGAQPWTPPA